MSGGQTSGGLRKATGRLLTFVWGLILVCGFVSPPVVWLTLVGVALLLAALAGVPAVYCLALRTVWIWVSAATTSQPT